MRSVYSIVIYSCIVICVRSIWFVAGFAGPPPNAYQLDTGLTHKGAGHRGHSASMKGRPTPLQYNGFSSTALVRLATLS